MAIILQCTKLTKIPVLSKIYYQKIESHYDHTASIFKNKNSCNFFHKELQL